MSDVLIVNAGSGGHAFIGLHLARALTSKGHKVSIFNDGIQEKVSGKVPFKSYPSLGDVAVKWGSAETPGAITEAFGLDAKFDVVVENNAKTVEKIAATVDFAADTGASQFLYVSSAGLLKKSDVVPLVEGMPENPKAGHVAVEALLASKVPFTAFRPQYIVGEDSAKPGYTDYFFDRVTRGRPVPLPDSGAQFASLTAVTDVANMIAAAVGKSEVVGEIFHMANNRYITFTGLVEAAAAAAGVAGEVAFYDAAAADKAEVKSSFPFRNHHFIAAPGKAMRALDWAPQTDIKKLLSDAYAEYLKRGRDSAEIDFSGDDQLLAAAKI